MAMAMAASASVVPPWPSLYDPSIEFFRIEHFAPVQPQGHYLYESKDIFRFTFYWTLIFYTPLFVLCGTYAFLNIVFPPFTRQRLERELGGHDFYPLKLLGRVSSRTPPRPNPRRTRLVYGTLVLILFLVSGVLGAVVASAIVGNVLAALFKAGKFNMSTWIPPIFALIQTLIGFLGLWPSVIEII